MLDKYCIYLKVYGERNAGTNFVEELVRANFAVRCLQSNNRIYEFARALSALLPKEDEGTIRSRIIDVDCERTMQSDFGWKHGIPPRDHIASAAHARHTLFLCVAKHPVAWLLSLARRSYNPIEQAPRTLSRLIRYDWPLTQRDNLTGCARINTVALWNVKNAAFLDLGSVANKCLVIAYEDILSDPRAFLARLDHHLIAKKQEFVWSLPSTKGEDMTFEQYRSKYDVKNICQNVSTEDLEFIRSRIDPRLMQAFGYDWPPAAPPRDLRPEQR